MLHPKKPGPRAGAGTLLAAGLVTVLLGAAARADVEIRGLDGALAEAARAGLQLAAEPCESPESRVRRLYGRAASQIRESLETYGYYGVKISPALSRDEQCWHAVFDVDPGQRVVLRKVEVRITGEGADDRELAALLAGRRFESGDGLDQGQYDRFKESLATLARQRGYFDGRFVESSVDVFPLEGVADIDLVYESGPRYRFGPVVIDQDVILPALAERFIEFHAGQPYDADDITSLYQDLLGAGYFEQIDIRTTPRPAPDLDVLVNITMTASRPRTWTAGAGYATDTGPKLRMDYQNERLGPAGHQLEFNSTASRVLGDISASYRLPWGRPRDEWLSFGAGYRYEYPSDRSTELYKFGVKNTKRRGDDWLEARFIDYSHERDEIQGIVAVTNLVVPGIGWSHQTDRTPVRPLSGHRVSFQVSGTDQVLGSETEFLQFDASGKVINPLWSGARLLSRLQAGYTLKRDFDELPFSKRYFAGGDTSVRGYDYKSLGPAKDGQVIGGSDLLVGSVEVDQQVLPAWAVAAFVDVGNAFDNFQTMNLKTGVGVGFRWYSPLGAVRVDFAFPLASDAPDSFRLHVTLGPDL